MRVKLHGVVKVLYVAAFKNTMYNLYFLFSWSPPLKYGRVCTNFSIHTHTHRKNKLAALRRGSAGSRGEQGIMGLSDSSHLQRAIRLKPGLPGLQQNITVYSIHLTSQQSQHTIICQTVILTPQLSTGEVNTLHYKHYG